MQLCTCAASLLFLVVAANNGSCFISGPDEDGRVQAAVVEKGSDLLTVGTFGKRLGRQTDNVNVSVNVSDLWGDSHDQILVHWTGNPSLVLFALTRRRDPTTERSTQSWLWRSTDNGKTFLNDTSKFGDDAVIEWFYVSPDEQKLIFTDVIHQTLYVTVDEGNTYSTYEVPFVPDKLTFQRQTIPNYQSDVVLGYDSTAQSLYVSQSLGSTGSWIPLCTGGVTRYFWRALGLPYEQNTTVYFEVDLGNNSAILKRSSSPFLQIDDFPQLGSFLPNSFYLTFEYMFVRRNVTVGSPLWVSYMRGPFQQASFPGLLPEMYYRVIDASEGQVFMAVYHHANTSSLYTSDQTGGTYSLSLDHVVSSPATTWVSGNPKVDVHPVEGLYGTYLANILDYNSSNAYGITVITFNKGGAWQRLAPPSGGSTNCSLPNCSLHLRMDSDVINGYQSILSQDSAIGFIMALGNLGPTLVNDVSSLNLYFSNDGGITWLEMANGSWYFQFVGHGSIVVAIPKWNTTNFILWSCDDGTSWHKTVLPRALSVVGMFTELGEQSLHASVFGYSNGWTVVDLDFSLLTNPCTSTQYSPWQHTNQAGVPICVLGEMVTHMRRAPGVCCLIDPDFTIVVNRSTCLCSSDDFECDVGFERTTLNSSCTPVEGYMYPPPPPTNCPPGTSYNYTSGYRRIPGDSCTAKEGDLSLPVVVPCPTNVWNMSTSIPGTSTSTPGSSTSIPGSSTSIPGSSTSIPGSSTSIPGSSTSIPGISTSIPGTSTSILGTSTSVPRATAIPADTSLKEMTLGLSVGIPLAAVVIITLLLLIIVIYIRFFSHSREGYSKLELEMEQRNPRGSSTTLFTE